MVCERWSVTKLCVKDGVSKMLCDKVVCERWPVTVCERWCVSKMWRQRWCVQDGVLKRCVRDGV